MLPWGRVAGGKAAENLPAAWRVTAAVWRCVKYAVSGQPLPLGLLDRGLGHALRLGFLSGDRHSSLSLLSVLLFIRAALLRVPVGHVGSRASGLFYFPKGLQ